MFLISIAVCIASNGNSSLEVIFAQGGDRFMDFCNHISYVRSPKEVYFTNYNACFPPLIYFLYYFFSLILTPDATVMFDAYATTSQALLLFIIYNVVIAILLTHGTYSLLKGCCNDNLIILYILSIVLSYTYIFGIVERGNSALIALILLIYAMYFNDSNEKWKQELALILIALAAAIKIYPALFGIMYIKREKLCEAIRLVIYGLSFFLVPFLFFGGIRGFKQFIENQLTLQNGGYSGLGTISRICNYLNIPDKYIYIEILVAMILLIFAFASVAKWEKALTIVIMMMVLPKWSGGYMLIYPVLPMTLYFKELLENNYKIKKINYFQTVLFALIVNPIYFSLADIGDCNMPQILCCVSCYLLMIMQIGLFLKKKLFVKKYILINREEV